MNPALLIALALPAAGKPPVPPLAKDPRLRVELVAAAPDLVTPVAVACHPDGRVFVIESHTHFPKKNYAGPKHDRIRVFSGFRPDGRAGTIADWHVGEKHSMGLGFHSDGTLWLATRKEIIRLSDANGDGTADTREVLLKLETTADYPHNGLSGFAFDGAGNAWFGLGENFGAPFVLKGADGSEVRGGGEGGSVFRCGPAGGQVRRWATGFWNPFHLCFDDSRRLYVVDNDPDERPPCRLLHTVEHGDFGYRFRNGRRGTHPFTAWNGELPFTLPMAAGTGEAPSGVAFLDRAEWPAEYRRALLGTSWGDHRVERFRLRPRGASFDAVPEPIVVGGEDFRPVGVAVAPDGALFVSDWVDKSYEVHGRGALWRIRPGRNFASAPAPVPPRAPAEARAEALRDGHASPEALRAALRDLDPFVAQAAFTAFQARPPADGGEALARDPERAVRLATAVALRTWPGDGAAALRRLLRDHEAEIRFAAVQTIAERRGEALRPERLAALARDDLPGRLLEAYLAALDRFEHPQRKPTEERSGAALVADFLSKGTPTAAQWRRGLPLLPPEHPALTPARLDQLLRHPERAVVAEALRTLAFRKDGEAKLRAFAVSAHDPFLRDEALAPLQPRPRPAAGLPPARDLDAWLKLTAGAGDANAGRRVFFHPQGPGCWKCHVADGRGTEVGPQLTGIGRSADRRRLLESILLPAREVAPRFAPWKLELADGRTLVALFAGGDNKNRQRYIDARGIAHDLRPDEIAERGAGPGSIMPEGLEQLMTPAELRDLLAFLGAAP